MKYDVFISYSRKDMHIATQVCDMLNRYACFYQFSYFFDKEEIKSRNEYLKRISSAISESKSMLFLASRNSFESEFCCKELLFADKRHVHIHQYRIDDSEAPDDIELLLCTHQYCEASSTSIETIVREVLSDVLECDIASISVLEQQRRRNEELERERIAAEQHRIRVEIDKLEMRSRELDREILEHKEAIEVLDDERSRVERELYDLRRILVEGTSVAKTISTAPAESLAKKVYKVGDYYDDGVKQGVVFDVWDGGRHGKIVSLDQAELLWSNVDVLVGAVSEDDGNVNTDKIMSLANKDEYPAFEWCRSKGKDWYLPAINELKLLLLNTDVRNAVNQTLKQQGCTLLVDFGWFKYYWSSTEVNEFCAWIVSVSYGDTGIYDKLSNYYSVRAVSAF